MLISLHFCAAVWGQFRAGGSEWVSRLMMAPAGTREVHTGPTPITRAPETKPSKCESENGISTDNPAVSFMSFYYPSYIRSI